MPDNRPDFKKTDIEQNNLRKLYSVGNLVPEIDEGNILAWQNSNLYYVMPSRNQFKVLTINGTSIKSTQTLTIPAGQVAEKVVVSGGYLALICRNLTSTEVFIKIYTSKLTLVR